jgi:hypothetical protein
MQQISRIEFFCDDRHVGSALRALAGIAVGQPKATPIVNAEAKNGRLTQATNGELLAMFSAYLKKHKLTDINAAGLRAFLTSIGRAPSSYGYLLAKARAARILKKMGGGTTTSSYRVLTLPALPAPKGA